MQETGYLAKSGGQTLGENRHMLCPSNLTFSCYSQNNYSWTGFQLWGNYNLCIIFMSIDYSQEFINQILAIVYNHSIAFNAHDCR